MEHHLTYEQFQPIACTSAKQYYDHLTDRFDRGLLSSGTKVISVTAIAKCSIEGQYTFFTGEKVTHADFCRIYINGEHRPEIRIITVASNQRLTSAVRIVDDAGILKSIPDLLPESIKIVSDLRYLVRKIYNFYRGQQFSFSPPAPVGIPELSEKYMAMLSENQREAMDTIFSSPISYISGAPGTGKTRALLSRCILRYVLNRKRVFLLAPTNNAVEQMLRGILPILDEAGISRDCVYRLGTSSAEFAAEYPQVIGDINLEKLLEDLVTRKQYCLGILDTLSNTEKQLNGLLEKQRFCIDAHSKVLPLYSELKVSRDTETAMNIRITGAEKDVSVKREISNNSIAARQTADHQVKLCEESIAYTRKRISELRLRFWRKSERVQTEDRLSQLLIALSQYQSALTSAIAAEQVARADLTDAGKELFSLRTDHQKQHDASCSLEKEILQIAQCDPDYLQSVKNVLSSTAESDPIGSFFESIELGITKLRAEISTQQVDTIRAELSGIEDQLSSLASDKKYEQKQKALILAGTIESSLSELSSEECHYDQKDRLAKGISHVFLDEAGYTALIKAMAAFAPGAPVTFLGDHKQLPPVCEMNHIPLELAPVCLWALPVSYISELMRLPLERLYTSCYCDSAEPSFVGIAYHALSTSYRFGQALADILSKYIYAFSLKGAATDPFKIELIDAPYTPGPERRTSKSECLAIRDYLSSRPDMDIAILSPYRNQTKYLRRSVPPEYQDNVLTVHRSQGREWDTVILSIVDTDSPYFTDSRLPIGRSVLNTAISRAKKRIVLVCDVRVWTENPHQMIEEMIKINRESVHET